MDRGPVTVGTTESSARVLVEAAEHPTGVDADLVLLSTFTREQNGHDLAVLDRRRGEHTPAAEADGPDLAKTVGEGIARRLLPEFDLEYTVVGAVVEAGVGRRIVSEAEDRGCDHVFVSGKRQFRIGGVVGDAVRRVLREFDGVTTVAYARETERRLARLRGSEGSYDLDWTAPEPG